MITFLYCQPCSQKVIEHLSSINPHNLNRFDSRLIHAVISLLKSLNNPPIETSSNSSVTQTDHVLQSIPLLFNLFALPHHRIQSSALTTLTKLLPALPPAVFSGLSSLSITTTLSSILTSYPHHIPNALELILFISSLNITWPSYLPTFLLSFALDFLNELYLCNSLFEVSLEVFTSDLTCPSHYVSPELVVSLSQLFEYFFSNKVSNPLLLETQMSLCDLIFELFSNFSIVEAILSIDEFNLLELLLDSLTLCKSDDVMFSIVSVFRRLFLTVYHNQEINTPIKSDDERILVPDFFLNQTVPFFMTSHFLNLYKNIGNIFNNF
ncbi:hypothetical protein GEMRC1_001337 [Eukaryota sp. GEM-RC1]